MRKRPKELAVETVGRAQEGIAAFVRFVREEPYQASVAGMYLLSCGSLFAFVYDLGHLLSLSPDYAEYPNVSFFLTLYFLFLTGWSIVPYTMSGRFTFAPRIALLFSTGVMECVFYFGGHHYAFWRMSAFFATGMFALAIADLMYWRDGGGNWKQLRAWGAMAAQQAAVRSSRQVYHILAVEVADRARCSTAAKIEAKWAGTDDLQLRLLDRIDENNCLHVALQNKKPTIVVLIRQQQLTLRIAPNESGEIRFFREHVELDYAGAAKEIVQIFLSASSDQPIAAMNTSELKATRNPATNDVRYIVDAKESPFFRAFNKAAERRAAMLEDLSGKE